MRLGAWTADLKLTGHGEPATARRIPAELTEPVKPRRANSCTCYPGCFGFRCRSRRTLCKDTFLSAWQSFAGSKEPGRPPPPLALVGLYRMQRTGASCATRREPRPGQCRGLSNMEPPEAHATRRSPCGSSRIPDVPLEGSR